MSIKINVNDKTEYDNMNVCLKCGGFNKIITKDMTDSIICEAVTICPDCGHEDYWAYGFYQSNCGD